MRCNESPYFSNSEGSPQGAWTRSRGYTRGTEDKSIAWEHHQGYNRVRGTNKLSRVVAEADSVATRLVGDYAGSCLQARMPLHGLSL